MARRRSRAENEELVAQLKSAGARGRLIHVKTSILVHDRVDVEPGEPCPCCGSRSARLVETRADLDLLFDRFTKQRKLRHEARDVAEWDRRAAKAELVEVPFRVSRAQLPYILEQGRKLVVLSGGSRSGKTQAACIALFRRILLRGGRGRRFWVVATIYAQVWKALLKFLVPDPDTGAPPILPLDKDGKHLLAERWPTSPRSANLAIVLLDGSRIEVLHAKSATGAHFKGASVVDIVADEVVEWPSATAFGTLAGRTAGTGGCTYVSSTPKDPDHWLKKDFIDKAEVVDPTTGERHGNPLFLAASLKKTDNVFYGVAEIQADLATYESELVRRREALGEWCHVGGEPFWVHYDSARNVYAATHYHIPPEDGLVDITPQVVQSIFDGDNPYVSGRRPLTLSYIGGCDVNKRPQTTLIAKVGAPPGFEKDKRRWVVYVVDEVVTSNSTPWKHSKWLQSHERSRNLMGLARSPYEGLPCLVDPSAGKFGVDTLHNAYRDNVTAPCDLAVMSEAGLDARSCHYTREGKIDSPRRPASHTRVQELLREGRLKVSSKCSALLKAFATQVTDPKNPGQTLDGRSGKLDKLASGSDACRYLCWGLFDLDLTHIPGRGRIWGLSAVDDE